MVTKQRRCPEVDGITTKDDPPQRETNVENTKEGENTA
jgi:hypothetical protein